VVAPDPVVYVDVGRSGVATRAVIVSCHAVMGLTVSCETGLLERRTPVTRYRLLGPGL
jgi:hypothetical protein